MFEGINMDLTQFEPACIGASLACLRNITRDLVTCLVTLKNPTEAKSPDELVRVVSIIQLWSAQQSDLLEQSCRYPVAVIRLNSEFVAGIDAGPSPWMKLTKCGMEDWERSLADW
jgi:hypothetical protein